MHDSRWLLRCRWIFEFEYKSEEDNVPQELKAQYVITDQARRHMERRNDLNQRLRNSTHVKCTDYTCRGAETRVTGEKDGKQFGIGRVAGLEEFETAVVEDLWLAISQEFPPVDVSPDPLEIENLSHYAVAVNRAEGIVGREDILNQLMEYVHGDKSVPFILWCDPLNPYAVHVASVDLQFFFFL